MEILNTIPGAAVTDISDWGVLAIVLFILTVVLIGLGAVAELSGIAFAGLVALWLAVMVVIIAPLNTPTGKFQAKQYEVIIKDPNYVIDATKYTVVEKRGKIMILEEIK
jgi:hypothetical protein